IGYIIVAVAVLDVISVKNKTSPETTSNTTMRWMPCKAVNCPQIHSDNPDVENPSAIASPPPNNNKIPQGSLTAVFQSSKRSPSLFLDGMRNRMMAKVIAMMASSIFGINFSKRAERKIQDNAAKLKMMKTAFSSKDGDPSFLFSSSITALPPGISFTFKG